MRQKREHNKEWKQGATISASFFPANFFFCIIYFAPQHFDSDRSGFIDKHELQSFMKRFIYQGLDLGEDEMNAAIEIVDTNKV